jgi:hypothetical protein
VVGIMGYCVVVKRRRVVIIGLFCAVARRMNGSLPWEGDLAKGIGWAGPEGEGDDHVEAEELCGSLDLRCL